MLLLMATGIYTAVGLRLAYRGTLAFRLQLYLATSHPINPKWKRVQYAHALRLVVVVAWPLFIWRG